MTPEKILEWNGQGESGSLEFKEEQARLESLAREMVAFDSPPVERTGFDDLDSTRLHDCWQSCYQIPYGDLDRGEQFNSCAMPIFWRRWRMPGS